MANALTKVTGNVIDSTTNITAGIITATSFVGSGANLTGVASTDNIRTNTNATFLQNINVTGIVTASGANVSGVSTFTTVKVGTAATIDSSGVQVGAGKSIRLYGATSGFSDIIAAAGSASTIFTLPANGGSNGQFLQTNGSGALSFAGAGKILQVVQTSTTTSSSTISVIPLDSSIPQNTEGAEILSASITPASTSNNLLIEVSLPFLDSDLARAIFAALFQDSTANALAGGLAVITAADYSQNLYFTHYMTASTTSSTTFKVRFGPNAGTAFINRRSSGENYGNVSAARLIIMEIAA